MSAAGKDATEQPIPKVYADESDMINVCCHACGYSRSIDVKALNKKSRTLKIRCRCGNSFRNRVEFRRAYRKQVKLEGSFLHVQSGMRDNMVVKDISRDGIGISVQTQHGFTAGDTMILTFNLDNIPRTKIEKKVKVRSIRGTFIGTQYLDSAHFDKNLGFYLMG